MTTLLVVGLVWCGGSVLTAAWWVGMKARERAAAQAADYRAAVLSALAASPRPPLRLVRDA